MSQRYLEEVLAWVGTKEVKGAVANPDIVKFSSYTSLKATSDEIAWCSSFVNFIVATCGDKPTGSAAARSWLDWGVVLRDPRPGCVVIIDRKDAANPHAAHVTFYVCDDVKPDYIQCIGGNQGDMVRMSVYAKSKVLGYRDVSR